MTGEPVEPPAGLETASGIVHDPAELVDRHAMNIALRSRLAPISAHPRSKPASRSPLQ